MANNGRPTVAPARRMFAAILGAIAAFVMLFGAGMASWAIVALGVALLVLAISLAVVNVARLGARAWVDGTAHVVSASEPPASSTYGRCELQLVVDAPGMPAAAIRVRDPRVPVAKWPDVGSTLPVSVAVDDLRRVRIQWEDVMTHAEAATVAGEVPPEYRSAAHDLLGDDLLVEDAAPPWATQPDRGWAPGRDATEPVTAELGRIAPPAPRPGSPREASAGPIVLEGTLVESGTGPASAPLPRRGSRPRPRPYRSRPPGPRVGDADHRGDVTDHRGDATDDRGGAPTPADAPVTSGTDLPPPDAAERRPSA